MTDDPWEVPPIGVDTPTGGVPTGLIPSFARTTASSIVLESAVPLSTSVWEIEFAPEASGPGVRRAHNNQSGAVF